MILINCPHCTQLIEIVELNCCIFRCGIYRENHQQIPPHLPKIECDRLAEQQLIFGCGKPFRIESSTHPEKNNEISYNALICDYI
jgi:hypothetical protein